MQTTTANLSVIGPLKIKRSYWLVPLLLVLICYAFIGINQLADAWREANDPAYKLELQEERTRLQKLDEQFKQIERSHAS
jgi:hypothetical protein